MKKLIAGLAFVASASVSYADSMGGGGVLGSAWVYLPAESVISNNNAVGKSTDYVLNVSVVDADKHTLAIGNGTGGDAFVLKDEAIIGGDTLDLSETIADGTGTAWTIVKFKNSCFRQTSPIRTFVAPRELVSIDGKIFDYEIPSGEQVDATFDCPFLTFLPNGTSGKAWVTLHLNVPSCTSIDQYAFSAFAKTDVSAWDLSGVETIGQYAFAWPNWPYGTMKLPRLKTIGALAFGQATYTRMEWGNRHNTLTSVGAKALNASCEEIVLGCAKGCTFASQAINASNLTRVWMTGAVPTFESSEIVFGVSQAEKSMVFYVPDNEEWAAIRAAATALTEEEIAAFQTAHPTWDVPFGVVAADVFQTANAQYIGTANLNDSSLGVYRSVAINNRSAGQYGDGVSVTVDGVGVTTGDVPYGTTVTVTATPSDNATVVSWEGKLPDGTTPTGNSFTYTATADAAFYAVFAHPWEYDATAGTISDGYWTLNVTADDSAKTLVVTGKATDQTGKGELNLSGSISTKGDSTTTWTVTMIANQAFKSDTVITSFYTPTAGFVEWGMQVFNGAEGVTNAVLNCPDISTKQLFVWGWDFTSCSLDRLVLNLPNLTKIGANADVGGIMGRATMADSDLSEWDLSSLTFIPPYGLQAGAGNGVGPEGDLVLPNVETINANAFYNWKRVTSAALGTSGTLKTLGATIFANNTAALTKLDFGTSWDFTTEETTFLADSTTPLPIEEVWFSGKAPSVTTLDNILALRTVAEDGTKPVMIFAPMMEKTWRAVCCSFTTEEDVMARAIKKSTGYRVVGVYQTQAGDRVAWLMQNPNFEYHSGFRLIIR